MCGFKTGGRNMDDLSCTYDTILTVENPNDLQALVRKVKEHSKKMELKIKTVVDIVSSLKTVNESTEMLDRFSLIE